MNPLDLHAGMKRCRTCDMRFLPDKRESYCQHCKAVMKPPVADAVCACGHPEPLHTQYGRDCCEEMPGRVFCPCDGYTPAPPAGAREEDEGR